MSGLLSRKALVVPLIVATCVLAHDDLFERLARRRAAGVGVPAHLRRGEPYPSDGGPQYSVPPLESIVPTPAGYTDNTLPVASTYAPGAQPTSGNLPAIPTFAFNAAEWPELDRIPPVDSADVQQWMSEIDWSTIPDYPPTASKDCQDPANAEAFAQRGEDGRCWWTCGQCTRDIDVTTCSESMQYGHTYDDGPGLYTPKLLRYLESQDLHATFFIVGSRAISYPDTLKYEYMTGHELSVHTWSHGGPDLLGLTSMTNEQVVAELGWTKKAIKAITGVTPTTMRPPYGDIDDRVRAIAMAMNLIPVIWTSVPDDATGGVIEWDSKDYLVHAGVEQGGVEAVANQRRFEQTLDWTANFTDHGVIVLQHDIYVEAVNLAIGETIPYLLNHTPAFDIKPVMQCQGRPIGDAYVETNSNQDMFSGEGDIATRTSNLGYGGRDTDDATSIPSRTYVSTGGPQTGTGTSTSTTTRSNASLRASAAIGLTGGVLATLLLAVSIVY